MRARDIIVLTVFAIVVFLSYSSAKSLPSSLLTRRLQRRQADVRLADLIASMNQHGIAPTGCADVGCGLDFSMVSKRSNADQRLAELQALISLYRDAPSLPNPMLAGKRSVQRPSRIYPEERDRETELVYRLLRRLAEEMDEGL